MILTWNHVVCFGRISSGGKDARDSRSPFENATIANGLKKLYADNIGNKQSI
jgi:hypothetical protein